jgi:hypothetical protein
MAALAGRSCSTRPTATVLRDDLKGPAPCPVLAPAATAAATLPATGSAATARSSRRRAAFESRSATSPKSAAAARRGRLGRPPLPQRGEHGRDGPACLALRRRNGDTEQRLLLRLRPRRADPRPMRAPKRRSVRRRPGAIGHAGDAYGLRSGLWIDRARGIGIAYFATGLGDDPPRGRSAYSKVETIEEWL